MSSIRADRPGVAQGERSGLGHPGTQKRLRPIYRDAISRAPRRRERHRQGEEPIRIGDQREVGVVRPRIDGHHEVHEVEVVVRQGERDRPVQRSRPPIPQRRTAGIHRIVLRFERGHHELLGRPRVVIGHNPQTAHQNSGICEMVVGGHGPLHAIGERIGSGEKVRRPIHRDRVGGPGHGWEGHRVERVERRVAAHWSQGIHRQPGVSTQQRAIEPRKSCGTESEQRRAGVLRSPEEPGGSPAAIAGMVRLPVLLGGVKCVKTSEGGGGIAVGELAELIG